MHFYAFDVLYKHDAVSRIQFMSVGLNGIATNSAQEGETASQPIGVGDPMRRNGSTCIDS